jgi:hypothetical protein
VSDESKHASVPATPRLPASHERLVLIQVGFSSGRQGAFQSAELTDGRGAASVLGLVGKHVFLTMDGGLDVGLLRAVVPLGALVWHVPELAFVRVLRQASNTQMKKLVKLRKDEERMLGVAADLLAKRPALARNMRIVAVEFQHDYKKLIVYAELTKWVKFNEYVKALRTSCEKEFKAHPRIFIQRKCALWAVPGQERALGAGDLCECVLGQLWTCRGAAAREVAAAATAAAKGRIASRRAQVSAERDALKRVLKSKARAMHVPFGGLPLLFPWRDG